VKKTVIPLILVLATALFTMGAKWEETYINRLAGIVGTWNGTGRDASGAHYTIKYWFKNDGSFKFSKTQQKNVQNGEQAPGALWIEAGKLYYKSGEGLWTFTLYEGKKEELMLRGEHPDGNTQELIPAK
jgi:hypothetical protein